ncbi:MAG TPA: glycosyl hydrolase [Gemmatimonadaceae bacterium]|nr:glycosyl hydrolase [Gemmatimonadaceae bacterium]
MTRSVPALLLAAICALPAQAQQPTAPAAPLDSFALRALHWRLIGPFRSGRSAAAAGSAKRPLEYWSGTTGGGVMKTTDGGYTWKPASDKYFGGTIGAIAVYPPNPDVVYVGTGEWTLRGNASYGDGVFKTTDGGATWDTLGLASTRQISRVIVHPWNPDVVYVAALGHESAPNPDRGVYRSRDGGKTWQKVLFVNDSVGATDLAMDPVNPSVLYAAMWRVQRKPWDVISGGAGDGIWKTTDGGDHWTEITRNTGLPKGIVGNIGLAVSPADHELVWALIESDSGGLFRSNDAGATWTRVNDENNKTLDGMGPHWRPFYFSKVIPDPKDVNTLYLPNGMLFRSTDGGRHFREVQPYNNLWDTHQLWIAPDDPDRMIVAADQGARVSFNRGATWSTTGYATGQFYHIIATNHFPYRVCGAQQDNVGACGPSRTDGMFDISAWYYPGGGESGIIAVDPAHPDVTYATGEKVDHAKGVETRMIEAWQRTAPPMTARYRFNWTTPIIASPHDPNTLYEGGNVLFKSSDGGHDWQPISPDLTKHDPSTLVISGRPITVENSGAENYATIFTIAESPVTKGVIWTGSDDGMIHVTRDGGAHWQDVTPKNLPPFMRMSIIDASPFAAGTAYLAANRQMFDDYKPYLFKTTDYGATWTEIDAGIPDGEFTHVVREDPVRRGLLFAGTERGVWFSFDDGAHWQRLQRNLPQVPVHDLIVKDGDVAIATHGRALWIMDDITPLRQMAASSMTAKAHLFDPADTYRVYWRGQQLIQNLATGEDPASGATIYYWLADSTQTVTLDIRDASGAVVNHFTTAQDSVQRADSLRLDHLKQVRNDSLRKAGVTDTATLNKPYMEPPSDTPRNELGSPPRLPAKQGLNVFHWTFDYANGVALTDTVFRLMRVPGPEAAPGRYTAALTVGGEVQLASFALKADPRISASGADLAARLAFTRRVNAASTEVVQAVNRAFALRQEVAARLAGDSTSGNAAPLRALRDSLLAGARRLAPRFYGHNQYADPYTATILDELMGFGYGDPNTAPNVVEQRGADTMIAAAHDAVTRFNASVEAQLAAVNTQLKARGQPLITGVARPH